MQPLYGAIIWYDCIINIFITFLMLKKSNSSKCASPYFYIGGFVAVYLSKIAATMVGPKVFCAILELQDVAFQSIVVSGRGA